MNDSPHPAELHAELRKREVEEYEQMFDLRYKADMRAIKRWREATGRHLVWPDHADLCVWLLEQNERLRAALEQIAGKNDLEGLSPEESPSAAYAALHEVELIARDALNQQPDTGRYMTKEEIDAAPGIINQQITEGK